MGIITITKLKCDKCGLEVNCAGFAPEEAKTIMKKRGWITPGRSTICPDCKTTVFRHRNIEEKEE